LLYDKIGVIVFVNGAHNYPMVDIITRHIYDRFLGIEQTPWHERALNDYLTAKKANKESRSKTKNDQVKNTQPSHALEDYIGEYESAAYGIVKIEVNSGKLRFDFNRVSLPLEHYHYDRFDSPDDELDGKWSLNFYTNPLGEVDKLLISLDQSEVTFTKKADAKLSDPATLKLYAGLFTSPNGTPIEVRASDEATLLLVIPGQPSYQLIPYKPGKFKMKEFSDTLIEFVSEGGRITGFKMTDPSGEVFYKAKG
jgi:hypothetical protein